MGILVKYSDVALGAKEAFVPTATSLQPFSSLDQLSQNGLIFPSYSTIGELNQTSLSMDITQTPLPATMGDNHIGIWSSELSGLDGTFTNAPVLTMTATGELFTSTGITLTFDEENNLFASELTIQWYNGSTLLDEVTFYPDAPLYFCENSVETYDKVVITFIKMNMPYSYLKLHAIDYGIIRVFENDEIQNSQIVNEINLISENLSINTFSVDLVPEEDVDFIFQKKQPIEVFCNGQLQGIFFVDKSQRVSKKVYNVQTVDYIGLLDKVTFMGGIYSGYSAGTLIDDIFSGLNIPYQLDEDLASQTITGYLPIMTCREALMQVAFALGAVVDTSKSEFVEIFVLPDETTATFDETNIVMGEQLEETDKLTELQLTEHTYTQTNETVTLYESGIGDNIVVQFSEPMYGLSLNYGTIVSSGTNYAIINATRSNSTLTGKKYNHTQKIISVKNPLITASDLQNIVAIDNATLINSSNSATIAQKCYDYFVKNQTVTVKLLAEDVKVGDQIFTELDYLGDRTSHIESMTYNLNGNKIIAEVVLR